MQERGTALDPASLGAGADQFNPRPIPVEEQFGRQNDRVGYLRSMGLPWAEAVFQLRDLLVGIEDDEFWDGIPKKVRDALPKMTKAKAAEAQAEWAPNGWDGITFRAVPGPGGRPLYRPTADELSHAYRIIMRLASRKGLTWRTKRISGLGSIEPGKDPADIPSTEDPAGVEA